MANFPRPRVVKVLAIAEKGDYARLAILLTVLSLFIGLWLKSFSAINSAITSRTDYMQGLFPFPFSVLLIIFTYLLFLFILRILSEISVETQNYKGVISEWLLPFVWVVILLFVLPIIQLKPKTQILIYALVLSLGLFFKILKKLPLIKHGHKFLQSISTKISINKYTAHLFFYICGFFIYYTLIIFLTSGVNVTTDKEFYFSNETVLITITPYGIIPPKIINVTYFNDRLLFRFNQSIDKFPASPRYLVLTPNLITVEPFNSFVTLNFRYYTEGSLLGYTFQKIKFIPIFSASNPETIMRNYEHIKNVTVVNQTIIS